MYHFNSNFETKEYWPYCYWDGLFTDEEINKIREYGDTQPLLDAGVLSSENKGVINHNIRKTEISWLSKNNDSSWFIETIMEKVSDLNNNYYHYDLTYYEDIQYTLYNKFGSKYDYHADLGFGVSNNIRKLSVVVFLSDNNEYTGGKFYYNSGTEIEIEQKKRRLIIFPSYLLHKVTPIKSGTRRSLVTWVNGPHFK